MLGRTLIVGTVVASFSLLCSQFSAAQALPCDNGAPAAQQYCKYFFHYNKGASYVNPTLTRAMSLGPQDTTRSIALILGVSEYPNAQDKALVPAKNDVEKLKLFLRDDQHVDEIVLLENDDASKLNIEYFLTTYIPLVAQQNPKTRALVIYSGHGVDSGFQGATNYLVLSQAKDSGDLENLLSLGTIAQYLHDLAPRTFHLLALFNSCFGGGIFRNDPVGGNIFVTTRTAANALTAGAPDELVYSQGKPGQGSIFFEAIINGIKSGQAAASVTKTDVNGKSVTVQRDVVRLGDLLKHVTDTVESINDSSPTKFSEPWEGTVTNMVSQGGFFFLSPQTAIAQEAFGPSEAPSGAVSSVYGRPDTKVFNQPYEYPIQGVDVSQHSGSIAWSDVGKTKLAGYPIGFAVVRATMGAQGKDEAFERNWAEIGRSKIQRGASHVFDFCDPAEAQIANIKKNIPVDLGALPLTLDLEFSLGAPLGWEKQQMDCFNKAGAGATRDKIRQVLAASEAYFKKTPIIYGNKAVFRQIITDDFQRYSVWLHSKREKDLPGRNPWTMWQYGESLIPGAAQPVDVNAFFGTSDDFRIFEDTGRNVSYDAAFSKERAPQ
jgi:GH25 family lysozyme M1 (1,4-beta-N-acetylmuramidase)